jgi:hypothetical protein
MVQPTSEQQALLMQAAPRTFVSGWPRATDVVSCALTSDCSERHRRLRGNPSRQAPRATPAPTRGSKDRWQSRADCSCRFRAAHTVHDRRSRDMPVDHPAQNGDRAGHCRPFSLEETDDVRPLNVANLLGAIGVSSGLTSRLTTLRATHTSKALAVCLDVFLAR